MKRALKWIGIALGILIVAGLIAFPLMRKNTKKHSPEQTAVYTSGNLSIQVNYSSPSKKGRVIFGELVPYGEVWRTGANEATEFHTNQDLNIQGEHLPKGEYSLWTIPGEREWKVMFNKETGMWGLGFDGKANRDPEKDRVEISVPRMETKNAYENLTLEFSDHGDLILSWDQTQIRIPIEADASEPN